MITEKEVFKIWDKLNLDESVREHSKAVQRKALEVAERLLSSEIQVDVELVRVGSLLHDIGRASEHSINHGLLGYKKLQELGLDESICKIAKHHVGAGINKSEAVNLGLPYEDYMPETLEEKIIAYADNLIDGSRKVDYITARQDWEEKFGKDSVQVKRLGLLHSELENFISVDNMRELDSNYNTLELMENAGKGIANILCKKIKIHDKRVAVFAGSGNNGGDGLVAARYLHEMGANVRVLQFSEPKTEACKENFEKVKELAKIVQSPQDMGEIYADIMIDALLGTGVIGLIREPMASGIKAINGSSAFKVSIDIPSGMNPDTGGAGKLCIKPDLVITLHRFKKGLVGKFKLGKVLVLDIGIKDR